jgi:hypothetical protein
MAISRVEQTVELWLQVMTTLRLVTSFTALRLAAADDFSWDLSSLLAMLKAVFFNLWGDFAVTAAAASSSFTNRA